MIASADFCRPHNTLDYASIVPPSYADDSLVPGADPYIAQLVAEHRAELADQMQRRAHYVARLPISVCRPATDLALV